MAVLQEALESIIQETFYQAVQAEKISTIGMPKIDIEKMAPGNEIVYKAEVALLPNVVLPKIDSIKVERTVKPVPEKQIDETLDALRGMRANETVKDGEATAEDKVVIDMDMTLDKVPVEGGQAKDYQVYLSEDHYIPGFNKALVGVKKGEEREFALTFPENHYQKMLAGKKVGFSVKVKDVFTRNLPELNDDFAKTLGQDNVAKLRELVQSNLSAEAEQKADQQWEIAVLDALIEKAEIETIPEVLIDAERQKMVYELKRDLERNGVSIEQYLADIKKTEKDLFNDFRAQADKRAKAALVSRQIALNEKLAPPKEEIDGEVEHMKHVYKDNKEYMDNLNRPEIRDSIATMIQNRKVMMWLRAKLLGTEMVEKAHGHSHDEHDGHKH
jgi:trigger factor